MHDEEDSIIKKALEYVRSNHRSLVENFISDSQYPDVEQPVSVFMAGSPGAGKTELSKRLVNYFSDQFQEAIVRIDIDEIRTILPGYNGQNASSFQHPAGIIVDKIHDHALRTSKNFILDATFANTKTAEQNVERSLKRNRLVLIFYVHQDPLLAWAFTQKREAKEGRVVPKDTFISSYFAARENIDLVKERFGDSVLVWAVQREYSSNQYRTMFNIQKVDNHIKTQYTREDLENNL